MSLRINAREVAKNDQLFVDSRWFYVIERKLDGESDPPTIVFRLAEHRRGPTWTYVVPQTQLVEVADAMSGTL